ncbi:Arc family DNA-binding protein [Duganella sp. BJB1802]|uniref:Arc family DNA-binding protein n=1 Tax=Duganella sp. BJB1802 TaxID=2744575 RepID=UPI001593C155|nr:Arc family DNA-binding protein [Duganella sp. BJB1802]NVD74520.1 Arc family DNA-binding protein [Duganella sp. BJB1802]
MTTSQITPFPLRLAPDLRQKLDAAAKKSGRSLQSEIAARLARTLEQEADSLGEGASAALAPVTIDIAELAKLLAQHLRQETAVLKTMPATPRARRAPTKPKG